MAEMFYQSFVVEDPTSYFREIYYLKIVMKNFSFNILTKSKDYHSGMIELVTVNQQ